MAINIPAGKLPPGMGPILDHSLLVNPQNKGVKNVMVWLVDPAGKPLPIHPKRAAVPAQPATITWAKLQFEPRIAMIRAGQPIQLTNNSPVGDNIRISGRPELNSATSFAIAAGAGKRFAGNQALKAEPRPLLIDSDVHGWMRGRIGVFDHPYFALTDENGDFEIKDAPAGNYHIFILHEKAGWLHWPRTAAAGVGGSKGQPINIAAGNVLNLGGIPLRKNYLKD